MDALVAGDTAYSTTKIVNEKRLPVIDLDSLDPNKTQ